LASSTRGIPIYCRFGSRSALVVAWQLSRSGPARTVASPPEHGLISRFRTIGKVPRKVRPRSDNDIAFSSRRDTSPASCAGLKQEFISPHCPQRNGMAKRVIWTLREQCLHRQRLESLQNATVRRTARRYNHSSVFLSRIAKTV
jgi:putative transposase